MMHEPRVQEKDQQALPEHNAAHTNGICFNGD